ncbi:MAG: CHAT domain-containing protein [Oscillatoriales cyanobacterium C42_A2020_001]|nr:CHAT domain-containing protein [Leptolyngbyaceae cyanobacterium C42_A2020_001]
MKKYFGLSSWVLTVGVGFGVGNLAFHAPSSVSAQNFFNQRAIAQSLPQTDQLLNAGQQQYQRGQLREALATYQTAREQYRRSGGSALEQLRRQDGEAAATQMVGLIYARLGQYQLGLDTLQQAAKLHETLIERAGNAEKNDTTLQIFFKNRSRLRSTLSFLGLIHQRLGQYQKAIAYNLDALARSGRSPGDYALDGEILNTLGTVYASQKQPAKALEAYYQAMQIVETVGYPLGRDSSTGGKPINFIEANKLIYSPQRPNSQDTTNLLEKAIQPTYHAPVRMHPWARYLFVATLNNIGNVYAQVGKAQAQFFFLKALDSSRFTSDQELEAISLNNVGIGYSNAGQATQAREYHQKALDVSRKLGDRALQAKTLTHLGTAFLQANDYGQATTNLTAAMEALESLRPGLSDDNFLALFETQTQTYALLQTALIAQKQPEQALEIAERGRARAFVELLTRRLQPVDSAQITVQPLNIAQIQRVAKTQNATLVEYSLIGNDTLYIWVVPPSGAIAFRAVDLKPLFANRRGTLANYIEQMRFESLGVRGRSTATNRRTRGEQRATSTDLQQLHRLLIEPIAEYLPKEPGSQIIFIPQGALFLVPFAALQNASGTYLIEQYTIAIAPSIQVLELTQGREGGKSQQPGIKSQQSARIGRSNRKVSTGVTRSGRKTIASPSSPIASPSPTPNSLTPSLIVGNPTMPKIVLQAGLPPEQLSDLPGAELEAKAIASLLKVSALTRAQATERFIVQQMPNNQLIHLATHGLLDDFQGLGVPGAIALAPDVPNLEKGDGLLTANEILDLNLNADLVVLSACDTGRGRITGDGVVGLSRSLLSVGASSVVVSLWSVPDAPTATLMVEFYQALLKNPNKAQALRQAMLTTLQEHPEPRDWAAFVLIGDLE